MTGSVRFLRAAFGAAVVLLSVSAAIGQGLSADALARLNELFLRSLEVYNAGRQMNNAAIGFTNAVGYGNEAAGDRRPSIPSGDWNALVASFLKAAKEIEAEKLATDFDEAPFSISWNEFRGCHTRDHAVDTLDKYSLAFAEAIERGVAADARFADLLRETSTISDSVTELLKLLEGAPDLFGQTSMNRLVLTLNVQPALAAVRSSTQQKRNQLATGLPKARNRKSALDSWLQQLRGTPCSLAGTWAGNVIIEGVSQPMTMEIRGEAGAHTLTYAIANRANRNPCIVVINPAERRLVFRPSCNPPSNSLLFSLTFAGSYTALSGAETDASDPDVNYPIAMQRR